MYQRSSNPAARRWRTPEEEHELMKPATTSLSEPTPAHEDQSECSRPVRQAVHLTAHGQKVLLVPLTNPGSLESASHQVKPQLGHFLAVRSGRHALWVCLYAQVRRKRNQLTEVP